MAKFKLFKEYRGLRKELYILLIGRIMTNLGSMIWPIFTLILNQKLGWEAGTIAIAMVVYGVIAMPITLLGGKLADKFNKKNLIIICDLISVGAFIYCGFAPMNLLTLGIFVGASLFQNIEWPSYDALVADFTTTKDRERAYSLSYLGANLGLVLSPTIAGILFNDYLNVSFFINAGAILASTILIFTLIKNVSKEKDDSVESKYQKDEKIKNPLSFIFHNSSILLFIILSGISNGVYMMYNYLMPIDMSAIYGDNGAVLYGTMSSVNCIVVVIFTAIITRLFRKIQDIRKVVVGETLILSGYALFAFLNIIPAFCYVAIVIFTFGEIFNTLASSPFLTRRIPASQRGIILAILNVFAGILGGAIQFGAGTLYDYAGSRYAWLAVIGAGLVAVSLGIFLVAVDKKKYPALYRGVLTETGSSIYICTCSLPLIKEFFRNYKEDPDTYLDSSLLVPYVYSDEKAQEYFNEISKDNRLNYMIMLDDNPIGLISIDNITNEDKTGDFYMFLQNDEVKNKGYGSIAQNMMISDAFKEFGFKSLTAKTISTNNRAQRVLEKAGFAKINEENNIFYYVLSGDNFTLKG